MTGTKISKYMKYVKRVLLILIACVLGIWV